MKELDKEIFFVFEMEKDFLRHKINSQFTKVKDQHMYLHKSTDVLCGNDT